MGIWEDHLPRLNTRWRPIVDQYREGKVKSTPVRGVKENLKPCAYKLWEHNEGTAFGHVFSLCDRVPFA